MVMLKNASSLAMGVLRSGSRIRSSSSPLPVDPQQQPNEVTERSMLKLDNLRPNPKHNAAVVLVTHSPAQIRELPNAAMLTESCPTKIVLPNPEARHPDQAAVYRTLGLNAREIDIIATATRKRDYYYKSTGGSRLFDLDLGPVALSLLTPLPGLSVQESTARLTNLIRRYGEDFLEHLQEAQAAPA